MPSIESAKAYVAATVQGARVTGAVEIYNPTGIVRVAFSFPGDANPYAMDVWIENGALYGEW